MATATEAADSFDSYSVDGGDFSSSIQSPSVHHKYHHQQQQQQQHHQFPKLPSLRQAMASLENNLHNNHTSLDYATSSPAHHVVPTAVAVAPPLPPTSLLHVGTSSSQQQLQKQLRQPYYGNYPDLSIPPPRISTTTSILSTNSIAPSVTSSSSSATTILPAPPSLSNSSPSLLSSLESKFAALGVDQVHGIESTYPVPSNNAITSSSSSSSSTGGSRSLRINDLISSNRTFATNINNTSLPSTKSDVRVRSPPPPSTHPGSSTTSSTSSTSSAMIENLINLEDITSLDQLEELERLLSGMVEK